MPTVLDGVSSNENVSLRWVPAIANPAAPKLATEINAASSVALECLLTQNFSPDASVNRISLRRMCSRQARERNGQVTRTIADLLGVYDPQDLTSPVSKAYAALEPGATGYLVARWGVHVDTPWAAGDLVDVYPVEVGMRVKVSPEDDNELQFKASLSVSGEVQDDVAVVA